MIGKMLRSEIKPVQKSDMKFLVSDTHCLALHNCQIEAPLRLRWDPTVTSQCLSELCEHSATDNLTTAKEISEGLPKGLRAGQIQEQVEGSVEDEEDVGCRLGNG